MEQVRKMLRIFLTDDALSSKVPQLTLRIADGDCIVKFQFIELMHPKSFRSVSAKFPHRRSGLSLRLRVWILGDVDAIGVLANCLKRWWLNTV